jgi:DNA-binding transcriptional MerR regulator
MKDPTSAYTLEELLQKIKDDTHNRVSKRTVYYYRQQGLLPPPTGAGRAARYSNEHVALIGAINHLVRVEHRPIAEIRTLLEGGGVPSSDPRAADLVLGQEVNILFSSAVLPQIEESPDQSPLNFGAGIDGGWSNADASSSEIISSPEDPGSARDYVSRVLSRTASVSTPRYPATSSPTTPYRYPYPLPSVRGVVGSFSPGLNPDQERPQVLGGVKPPFIDRPGGLPPDPGGGFTVPVPPPVTPYYTPRTSERSTWERIYLSPDLELAVRRPTTRESNRALSRIIESAKTILEEEGIK